MANVYLSSAIKQFNYYKLLGDKTIDLLSQEQLLWQANEQSNSVAMIVQHMHGNMLSRWTNFLTEDGEKPWRQRDAEFEIVINKKEEIISTWNTGWQCLFNALESLTEADLTKIIYIRNMGQTVTDAINRQIAHYSYHVGQIVFLGKLLANENWQSLSIPKGNSQQYNSEKFGREKRIEHFTDETLKPKE
jgi:hypothetical protein